MGIFGNLFSFSSEPLPEQATLIDVRSPGEFASGHLDDAIHLPLDQLGHHIGNAAPDKAVPIVVYCQSGARSASARQQLIGMGYQQVVNGGGIHSLAGRMNRKIVR